jgi:hypothetical protein
MITGNTQATYVSLPEKKKSKNYWTEETEEAVRGYLEMDTRFITSKMQEYLKERNKNLQDETIEDGVLAEFHEKIEHSLTSEVQDKKNRLYKKFLEEPLNTLVESILFRYKLIRYDIDVKTAHNECLGHIHDKLANFDPYKGTKSYSYYGTMAKNYFMNEKKKYYETKSRLIDYEDHKPEVDAKRLESLDHEGKENKEGNIMFELFYFIKDLLEEEVSKGEESKWTKNDIMVSKALVYILTNHEDVGAYNKVDIYKEIAEETKLQRKDITYSLTRIRAFYKVKRQGFIKKKEE